MTKTIEEALNLPPMPEVDEVARKLEHIEDADFHSPEERQHIKEMDEVIDMAVSAHKSILDFGFNVEAKDAGKIFAQAAAHLDIAVKASRSKADLKGKLLSLQLQREQMVKGTTPAEIVDEEGQPQGRLMTREELLNELIAKNKAVTYEKPKDN